MTTLYGKLISGSPGLSLIDTSAIEGRFVERVDVANNIATFHLRDGNFNPSTVSIPALDVAAVVAGLEALTGSDRLPATAIAGLHTSGAGIAPPDAPIAGFALVYDATSLRYVTERLTSVGLADDAIDDQRLIGSSVITPSALDITQLAEFKRVLEITQAGLARIYTDATLTGGGTSVSDPLSVASPYAETAVTALIDARAVRSVTALPSTVVSGQALLLDGQTHYWGYILGAVDSVQFTLTAGATDSQQGFDRATGLGSLSPDVFWIDRLWHNDDTQRMELVIRSYDDPGTMRETGLPGNPPFVGAGTRVSPEQNAAGTTRDYTLTVATSPFADGGTYAMTLNPTASVSAWQRIRVQASGGLDQAEVDARIAPWARFGQAAPSGGTGGLNQAAVDARVQAGVIDQAETGNTDRWPKDKLPADTQYGTDAFIGLTDTPSAYGTEGQVPAVNAGRNGMVFTTPAAPGLESVTTEAPLTGTGTAADPVTTVPALAVIANDFKSGGWANSEDIQISVRTPLRDLSGAESLVYASVVTHDGPNTVGEGYFLRVPASKAGKPDTQRLVGDDNSDSGEQVRQSLRLDDDAVTLRGPNSAGVEFYYCPENSLQGSNSVDDYHYRAQEDSPSRLDIRVPAADVEGLDEVIQAAVPPNIFTQRLEGNLIGVTVNSLGANTGVVWTNVPTEVGGSTTIDLDDLPERVWVWEPFTVTLVNPNPSGVYGVGLSLSPTEAVLSTVVQGGDTTTTLLLASTAYSATEFGIAIRRVPVYVGQTEVGRIVLYNAHDGANLYAYGFRFEYDSRHSLTGSFSASITNAELHSYRTDGGPAASGGGGGHTSTITTHTWVGSPTVTIPNTDVTPSGAWTDLQSLTLPAGNHLVYYDLHFTVGGTGVGWIGLEMRLQRGGSDVWNAPGQQRFNGRGNRGQLAVKETAMVSGAGTYTLQARAATDNTQNISPLTFAAGQQDIQILTFN